MRNFEFYNPTRIVWGRRVIAKLKDYNLISEVISKIAFGKVKDVQSGVLP